jgi:nucleotide-binding universal stress UspA family protein
MRILLAYDGSAGAEIAVDLVASTRWPDGSSARVVSVLEPTLMPVPMTPAHLLTEPDLDRVLVGHLEGEVRSAVERLEGAGLVADGTVLRGRPATTILDDARASGAELILAGSRGRGALATLVLGSVSAELAEHASCDVVVARGRSLGRVLFATDGSDSAQHAEGLLTGLPAFADAPVRVISVAHVVRPWHTGVAPMAYGRVAAAYARDVETARAGHTSIAHEAASRLRAGGLDPEVVVRDGDPAEEIVAEARSWGADTILVGSRGRTGLTRMLMGSVARNVLLGTEASVIVSRTTG